VILGEARKFCEAYGVITQMTVELDLHIMIFMRPTILLTAVITHSNSRTLKDFCPLQLKLLPDIRSVVN